MEEQKKPLELSDIDGMGISQGASSRPFCRQITLDRVGTDSYNDQVVTIEDMVND